MTKKLCLIFTLGLIWCMSLLAAGGHNDQDYLNSKIEYYLKRPTGPNTPIIHPLEGLKTEPYHYADEEIAIEVLQRTPQMTQFACTQCHDKNGQAIKEKKPPHDHIKLTHGKAKGMDCFTCHDKTNRDTLHSDILSSIPFNQSAQLCFQCHSSQHKDWTKGAHGKRVGTWTGRRVIYNCTQCHNPHDPGFDQRLPKALPKMRGVKR